ncbi:isoprenylcysteine carboxylmethyltransferase family protein [Photobacterium profundum]|uniref:Isoprenylcysteine carboxylmethyltransferase family protein n=1 Tax=Photobacterium profundum 3TCK TaxID=314280 RepID=Q1YYX6_9GAMM|nr:isoprenylcysteine carboxylmethyltransferase family protein [Photobacterium profundum]EAS41432.1 hypothetical protein P3TCK_06632 [Photobacterium profundum 3TCK]PSV62868.1 isoprenylcysteine carboxylmethyltransferase family protein [Photobacterium profundum]
MSLKLPPPLLLLLSLGGMYLLTMYWPLWVFVFPGQSFVVLISCFLGAILGLAGIVSFAKARTSIDPRKPQKASRLITSGIYRYSRNPMYLGLVLFQLAAVFYFGAISCFLMLGIFFFFMNNFQIEPEEEVLTAIFGDDYKKYCSEVRRWC